MRLTHALVAMVVLGLVGGGHAPAEAEGGGGGPKAAPAPGVLRGLVVRVEFPDTGPGPDAAFARERFFEDLDAYVGEMSYGKASGAGDVTAKASRVRSPSTASPTATSRWTRPVSGP